MSFELIPTRVRYDAGQPVTVEVRATAGAEPRTATVSVQHLGDAVSQVTQLVASGDLVDLGSLPPGGYGVELADGDTTSARTAVEVTDPDVRPSVLRYGFVTNYVPDRDPTGVTDNARRLHLTHIQFYDWAYRHADLLGGGENYRDALDQPISLATVGRLIAALDAVGAHSLGYAAVYGVGNDEWASWEHIALLRPTGSAYSLGDFLRLVDPADRQWLDQFTTALAAAADQLGFHGFHLDQYGYPKIAATPDGNSVDLAESFATTITEARRSMPEATLVFNNVNDFPTWRTADCPQDAVYIEVWPPHDTLGHLADLVTRTHAAARGKPVVIAAYQHVYDQVDADDQSSADRATALTMATLFSHGASQLLCGEADRILVDPYYVRNHQANENTRTLLARWYDFAVEHGELLFSAGASHDLTGSLAGVYNDDCDVRFDDLEVCETATPGTVWRRITRGPRPGQLVVHLINLIDQPDTLWDAPRSPVISRPGGTLRLRRGVGNPKVRIADPDAMPALRPLVATGDPADDWTEVALPPLNTWQLLLVDLISGDEGAVA